MPISAGFQISPPITTRSILAASRIVGLPALKTFHNRPFLQNLLDVAALEDDPNPILRDLF